MSTLDNLNENILHKIDLIDKLIYIFIDNLSIPINKKKFLELKKENLPISFIKNIDIFNKRYLTYLETKSSYEIQSILFLVEYYNINNIQKLQYNTSNNIYNDNIFLLANNTQMLNNNDLLLLKCIYYNNYYKYKFFNNYNLYSNKLNINYKLNNNLSKKIYHNFNIFISSEDIYGVLDNFIDFIYNFINQYKESYSLFKILNNEFELNQFDKCIKKIIQIINLYKKTKIIYNIDDIEYDLCKCGNKMIIQANTSELLCIKCGSIHTLVGSVFENSQFYQQEGNRYMHGTYDPNRHCKFWIDRIQAKENTIIENDIIEKIKSCIKKDKIENIKNISIEQFRLYLKQTKLSKLNDHIPLIKKMITGYIPPQLDHKELHLLFNYFDKATKIYNQIKPKEKSNSLYYPFLIWKILDLIIENPQKKKELLSCIHLQSYETLIDNDKIWYQICKYNDNFIYKPTDKSILY